jgi:hypothetical protein
MYCFRFENQELVCEINLGWVVLCSPVYVMQLDVARSISMNFEPVIVVIHSLRFF